jgi:hypothetical protein
MTEPKQASPQCQHECGIAIPHTMCICVMCGETWANREGAASPSSDTMIKSSYQASPSSEDRASAQTREVALSAGDFWEPWFEENIERITRATAENQPKLIYLWFAEDFAAQALRASQREIKQLADWKESMMALMGRLQLQEIGRAMNLPLGEDIAAKILPWVRASKERERELKKRIEQWEMIVGYAGVKPVEPGALQGYIESLWARISNLEMSAESHFQELRAEIVNALRCLEQVSEVEPEDMKAQLVMGLDMLRKLR